MPGDRLSWLAFWIAILALLLAFGFWIGPAVYGERRCAPERERRDCPECDPTCCPGAPGRDCCCRTMDDRCKCRAPHDPSTAIYGG